MTTVHPQFDGEKVLAILSRTQLAQRDEYEAALRPVFPRCELVSPADLEELRRVVAASSQVYPLVLAIGGDGTLHQVLQHIDLGSQVLGILPAGTGNDFARVLHFPEGIAHRVMHLARLSARPTDIGLVNGIRYHNSAGFGLDSQTLQRREQMRGALRSNYTAVFLLTLRTLHCDQIEVEHDGHSLSGRFYWVLCMNTPFIGGGTKITPGARIDDGKLNMLLIRETSKLALLRYLPRAIRGEHLKLPMTVHAEVRNMVCRSARPIEFIAVDGELYPCPGREVEFAVQYAALRFLR